MQSPVLRQSGRVSLRRSAAPRRRQRSPASVSQRARAAARAAESSGGTRRPGTPRGGASHGLRDAADRGREHGHAGGQRLGDDHAVGLRPRGDDEQVGVLVLASQRRPGAGARASGRGRRCRWPWPGAPATRRSRGSRSSGPTRVQRQGRPARLPSASSSRSWPLSGESVPTHSSRPPSGVRGLTGAGSVPGWATCTRAAGSAVPLEQPAAGPVAGGDDGPRGGEHGRLVALRADGVAHRRPCAPGRRAAAAPTRGTSTARAAEAISPSTRTSAPSGRASSDRASAVSARASGRGHGPSAAISVTRPPGVAQVVADLAVVAVAAADPRGIVDPGRDDDVDGAHRRRS